MLTQFDEICQRKDDLEKRCIRRHESPLPALKTRVFYHRDGYNKRYARYAVAYAAEKTIDPEKPKATSKTASISEKSRKAPYASSVKLIDSLGVALCPAKRKISIVLQEMGMSEK